MDTLVSIVTGWWWTVLKSVGAAEGEKIKAVGEAEAEVIKRKIASMDSGNYAAIEVAKALATSGHKLVPEIVSGSSGGSSSLVDTLMALVLKDKMSEKEALKVPISGEKQ